MPKTINDTTIENLRTIYDAIVDYHNNLVNIRFTTAGLYLAATSFLASSWFSPPPNQEPNTAIVILGFLLTTVCLFLELRTYHLLLNLGIRGLKIERKLYPGPNMGFFELMGHQPEPVTYPYFRKAKFLRLKIFRLILSHSTWLPLLYVIILGFWVYLYRTTP